eukprot:CAMPEP_0185026456 /NCGR_PEP_ID=MMETSP1103-20130426/10689_1 /TAXON_ID=36769 /ORGANISM="Paraphysomonas bandaiensis, Strain Caron Lab Isolate" /LENGTH=36 /DNA_ID= /DNA_START= /DNA_END= /DNA_ORIENTATION=
MTSDKNEYTAETGRWSSLFDETLFDETFYSILDDLS